MQRYLGVLICMTACVCVCVCVLRVVMCGAGPGEPDCHFFLKTGNCKFGEGCRFNHPPEKVCRRYVYVHTQPHM